MNLRYGIAAVFFLLALTGCDQPAPDPMPRLSDPRYTDAWISQQALIRLDADPQLHPFRFHVQSHETVLFVQGTVPSEALRRRAERVAAGSPYVSAVRNNVSVITVPLPAAEP